MQPIATIESIQVGAPRTYRHPGTDDRPDVEWQTSFFRVPSPERRWLHTTHLDGNAQADTENHGQPSKAVLLYDGGHYARWRERPGLHAIGPGGMAENLTLAGLSETSACIGDVYQIGEARIEVTGPRYPCYKIGRRWGVRGLELDVAATGRTGWYCQVLTEGWLAPGATLSLVDRPFPAVTVALVNDLGHGRNRDHAAAVMAAACPSLPEFWRGLVLRRTSGEPDDEA